MSSWFIPKPGPSVKRVREVFRYDPLDGWLYWKQRNSNRTKPGERAGTINKQSGYVFVGIDGTQYRAHRLIWAHWTGEWPSLEIDHINGNRADNRIKNLREVSRWQNAANSKLRADSTTKAKGVYWSKVAGKWGAQTSLNYKPFHLGFFDSFEEAKLVAAKVREQLHGEFCRHE